jgi:prepilin peptidase CpaA
MHSAAWWPTLVVISIATFTDIRSRRVPNWLVLPFMAAGPIVSIVVGGGHGLLESFLGWGLAAVVFGFLNWLGGMGMGDVKLMAAVGAWIGPSQLLIAMIVTFLAGGVMAIVWSVSKGFAGELFSNTGSLVGSWKGGIKPHNELNLDNPTARKMPYVPAIAIGVFLSFFAHAK